MDKPDVRDIVLSNIPMGPETVIGWITPWGFVPGPAYKPCDESCPDCDE